MEKIRLANGSEYGILGGSTEQKCSIAFRNLNEAVPVIEDFSKENMTTVEFLTEGGEVCGTYHDKELVSVQVKNIETDYQVDFLMADVVPEAEELLAIIVGGEA